MRDGFLKTYSEIIANIPLFILFLIKPYIPVLIVYICGFLRSVPYLKIPPNPSARPS